MVPEKRDRPLTFHWRGPSDWLGALGMQATRSLRHAQARTSILLEALLAHAVGSPAVSYSRRKAFYAHQTRYRGTAFTYDAVVSTVDDLAANGWLENLIAFGKGPCGRQSTFRAADALLAVAPADLITLARFKPFETVILRDTNGNPIPYPESGRTFQMRRALIAANDAIQSCDIAWGDQALTPGGGAIAVGDGYIYPGMRTLYRVFNGSFGQGGRLYGPFWQQMPKICRASLRIDGASGVEEDYTQLHPRLVYRQAEVELIGDAYTLDGWDRDLCKTAFNILLNATNYRSAVLALASEIGGKGAGAQAERLIAQLKLKHSPIADYFHTGIGLLLQRIDADMAELVITRLLGQGIVALPIHDSFIVKESHHGALQEAMADAFSRAC